MKPLFTPLRVALLVCLLVVAAAGFVLIPAGTTVPIHWGVDGQADGFAPRELALLMPLGIAAVVWLLFIALTRLAPAEEIRAGGTPLGVALTAVTGLALVIAVVIVLVGIGVAIDVVQVIAIAIGVLFVVIGYALPQSQPNSLAGLRIPTTLRDPDNWAATHRLAGALGMLGGLVLIVAALVVPAPALIWWLLACVFLPFVVGAVYSVALARRRGR